MFILQNSSRVNQAIRQKFQTLCFNGTLYYMSGLGKNDMMGADHMKKLTTPISVTMCIFTFRGLSMTYEL